MKSKIFILVICLLQINLTNSIAQTPAELQAQIDQLKQNIESQKTTILQQKEGVKNTMDAKAMELDTKFQEFEKEQNTWWKGLLGSLLVGALGAIGGFFAAKKTTKKYTEDQLKTIVDNQIQDQTNEWNQLLSGQKLDTDIVKEKQLLCLSFIPNDKLDFQSLMDQYKFPKSNVSYLDIKFKNDSITNRDELVIAASNKDLVVFNTSPNIFGDFETTSKKCKVIVKELINDIESKSKQPYFFGYTRGVGFPRGIDKLNFCTNKYTLKQNLMDSLRYQRTFEEHNRTSTSGNQRPQNNQSNTQTQTT